jgi:hypothetical protein
MDLLAALILSCSFHYDDHLVEALARKLSITNQYFGGDLSDLNTYDSAKSLIDANRIVDAIIAKGDRPAVGFMAVPVTWAARFGRTTDDLFDGCTNISIATAMLSESTYAPSRLTITALKNTRLTGADSSSHHPPCATAPFAALKSTSTSPAYPKTSFPKPPNWTPRPPTQTSTLQRLAAPSFLTTPTPLGFTNRSTGAARDCFSLLPSQSRQRRRPPLHGLLSSRRRLRPTAPPRRHRPPPRRGGNCRSASVLPLAGRGAPAPTRLFPHRQHPPVAAHAVTAADTQKRRDRIPSGRGALQVLSTVTTPSMPLDLPHSWPTFPRRLHHPLHGPLATGYASAPGPKTLRQLPLPSRQSRRWPRAALLPDL